MPRISMIEIYNVGKWFTHLYRSRPKDAPQYKRRWEILAAAMQTCGLTQSEKSIQQIAFDPEGPEFSEDRLDQIRQRCIGMDEAIKAEVASKFVLLLPDGIVTPKLDVLRKKPQLIYDQSLVFDEIEVCIQAGAYRPAIVQTWNAFYDYVRQWVFAKSGAMADVNTELVRKNKAEINNYPDFLKATRDAPSESMFLEICKTSIGGRPPILNEKQIISPMVVLLGERNRLAHATFQNPTLNEANHFVDRCASILSNPPFV